MASNGPMLKPSLGWPPQTTGLRPLPPAPASTHPAPMRAGPGPLPVSSSEAAEDTWRTHAQGQLTSPSADGGTRSWNLRPRSPKKGFPPSACFGLGPAAHSSQTPHGGLVLDPGFTWAWAPLPPTPPEIQDPEGRAAEKEGGDPQPPLGLSHTPCQGPSSARPDVSWGVKPQPGALPKLPVFPMVNSVRVVARPDCSSVH